MLRLGSVVLASVLLGVPRAVETRAFGVQRAVYIDVAPQAPELLDFAAELKRAIGAGAYTLASRPSKNTVVIELLNVSRSGSADGRSMEAAAFSLRDDGRTRRVMLHYPPGERARAAQLLLDTLSVSGD